MKTGNTRPISVLSKLVGRSVIHLGNEMIHGFLDVVGGLALQSRTGVDGKCRDAAARQDRASADALDQVGATDQQPSNALSNLVGRPDLAESQMPLIGLDLRPREAE